MAAIEAAMAAGFGIEIDVQVSGDGIAMVFHDPGLARMTGDRRRVAGVGHRQLGRLRLEDGDETIPRLVDVLDAVDGRVPLLIDVKNLAPVAGPLEAAVARDLAGRHDRVALMIWTPGSLVWFRRHLGAVPVGHIVASWQRGGAWYPWYLVPGIGWFARRRSGMPDFLAYDIAYLPHWLARRARARGTPVLTWTVRTQADIELARREADNIIFEGFLPDAPQTVSAGEAVRHG